MRSGKSRSGSRSLSGPVEQEWQHQDCARADRRRRRSLGTSTSTRSWSVGAPQPAARRGGATPAGAGSDPAGAGGATRAGESDGWIASDSGNSHCHSHQERVTVISAVLLSSVALSLGTCFIPRSTRRRLAELCRVHIAHGGSTESSRPATSPDPGRATDPAAPWRALGPGRLPVTRAGLAAGAGSRGAAARAQCGARGALHWQCTGPVHVFPAEPCCAVTGRGTRRRATDRSRGS